MDGKAVDGVVRERVRPLLRAHGFTRFTGRSGWRSGDETVELVVLRSFTSYVATGVGCTTFSFAVTAGVAYRCLDPNLARPKDYELTFRFELGKNLRQPFFHPHGRPDGSDRPDVWYVLPDGSNLEEAVDDAAVAIEQQALPLLDVYRDPPQAFEALLGGQSSEPTFGTAGIWLPGDVGSPRWHEVALAIGHLVDPDPRPRLQAAVAAAQTPATAEHR